jgi:integral membrane protein (TIGR01906 family)
MKYLRAIYSWMTAILIPVALIFLGLRLALTTTFINLEYRMPGFPDDLYGFTLDDRLNWSELALQYLVNDSNVDFLGDLTFPDGTPLYNQRELSHMLDVKSVVKPVLAIGYATWIILIGAGILSFRWKLRSSFINGLRIGGWMTIGILGTVSTFALVSFWKFFTVFHSLFFEGDSWIFLYSDTLIRLFPLRFWQDVFLLVGIIVLGGSLGLVVGLKPKRNSRI